MIHTGSNYSMVLGHCHRFSIIVMSALYLKKHFTYVKQVPCAHFTTASASILAQLRRFINHLLTYLLTGTYFCSHWSTLLHHQPSTITDYKHGHQGCNTVRWSSDLIRTCILAHYVIV